MKKVIALIAIVTIIAGLEAFTTVGKSFPNTHNYEIRSAVVTKVDDSEVEVKVNNNYFTIQTAGEDFLTGDIVNIIVDDHDTEIFYDDEIVGINK